MNFQFPISPANSGIPLRRDNFQYRKIRLLELFVHLVIITFLVLATARPIAAQIPTPIQSGPTVGVMMEKEGTTVVSASAEGSGETKKKKSEYQLPYPGLLPDHPLYILKTIRDRIIDFLIADPLKKAEFTLLAADKRLASAVALVEKGKPELAESTASKGQAYLSRSLSEVKKAKSQGKETTTIVTKLKNALAKHEEVLVELSEKTSGSVKDRFTAMKAEVAKHRQSF